MATAVVRRIIVGPNRGTNAHPSEAMPEAANQTFKAGSPVIPSSGYVATAGTTPVANILGFAEEDAENNATAGLKKVRVALVDGGTVFEGTFATGGNAVALAQSDLFVAYGLTVDGNGIWYVDKAKVTTDAAVIIVGFRDAVGTSDARVYFKVLTAATVGYDG